MSVTTLRRRTTDACARWRVLQDEVAELHDPQAIELAYVVGVAKQLLVDRLEELEHDTKEV